MDFGLYCKLKTKPHPVYANCASDLFLYCISCKKLFHNGKKTDKFNYVMSNLSLLALAPIQSAQYHKLCIML